MDEQKQIIVLDEKEALCMLQDSSQLAAKHSANELSSAAIAAQGSNALTNNVEFWKWMGRNYRASGIFDSPQALQQYIAQGEGKAAWMAKQLQGKGYEWDWMATQRANPTKMFNTYDAGDVANRAASDVTERNILTGQAKEYQMKAYIKKANPDLHNTPKDMTVVTNSEKASVVRKNGYQDVQEFQNAEKITKATDKRMEQARTGAAQSSYNLKNVSVTMAKAGLVGCVVGMGVETAVSYRAWKSGALTDQEYLKEILKAGGDAGITSAATSGIMIPISAAITTAGVSNIVTIPIAIVVSAAISKIVAPCFGRGDYAKILANAKYYNNLDLAYEDMVVAMQNAGEEFYMYVSGLAQQQQRYYELKKQSRIADNKLEDLLDSI